MLGRDDNVCVDVTVMTRSYYVYVSVTVLTSSNEFEY